MTVTVREPDGSSAIAAASSGGSPGPAMTSLWPMPEPTAAEPLTTASAAP